MSILNIIYFCCVYTNCTVFSESWMQFVMPFMDPDLDQINSEILWLQVPGQTDRHDSHCNEHVER